MVALDQAHALCVQAQRVAAVVQRLDAGEQLAVEADGIGVRGELGGVLALQLLAVLVGVGTDQREEHGGRAVQHLAALFHGNDGVFEGRGIGVVGDGLDFLQLLGHAGIEGGSEMAVLDLVELRVMQRQRALGEERVGSLGGFGSALGGGIGVGGHGESKGCGKRKGEAGSHSAGSVRG